MSTWGGDEAKLTCCAQGHSSTESKSRPLFMHFSGPTGVGKTYTADIVAKSVLSRPVDGTQNKEKDLCGKMAVQMRAFVSTDPADIAANTAELRSKVAEQLYNCPRSVIIFDEIQVSAVYLPWAGFPPCLLCFFLPWLLCLRLT